MKTVILLPCFNEAATISTLINELQKALPDTEIHVFDNNSTDGSQDLAKKQGAVIHQVKKQGKGHVVKAMFRDIDADYYIMMDADGTYPTKNLLSNLEQCIDENIDMLIGNRINYFSRSNSRKGHYLGNRALTKTLNFLFSCDYSDILSGYRIMSRRFVKSVPLFSEGFEIETILSVHTIEVDAKFIEVNIDYLPRSEESPSKLNTVRDGFKILVTIIQLFHDFRPKLIYGLVSFILFMLGLFFGTPVIIDFFKTGLVERFPTAILATGLIVISFIIAVTGIILDSISKNRKTIKKLAFLSNK